MQIGGVYSPYPRIYDHHSISFSLASRYIYTLIHVNLECISIPYTYLLVVHIITVEYRRENLPIVMHIHISERCKWSPSGLLFLCEMHRRENLLFCLPQWWYCTSWQVRWLAYCWHIEASWSYGWLYIYIYIVKLILYYIESYYIVEIFFAEII